MGRGASAVADCFESMRAGRLSWLGTMDVSPGETATGSRAVLLATWLLIRQPAEERRALHCETRVPAPRSAQKHLARMGNDPTQTVRYITLRQNLRRPPNTPTAEDHAQRIYHHRWFVQPHKVKQFYPSTGERKEIWRGPYLVVPAGCEEAPIIGGDRVNVLRR